MTEIKGNQHSISLVPGKHEQRERVGTDDWSLD